MTDLSRIRLFPGPWVRRYRLRLKVLLCLLGTGFWIWAVNALFAYFQYSERFRGGSLKITSGHFFPPEKSLLVPSHWGEFLERATAGKPGILGSPWPYLLLAGLFLIFSVWVFLRLTPPDKRPE